MENCQTKYRKTFSQKRKRKICSIQAFMEIQDYLYDFYDVLKAQKS